jgi:hypothetical protein
MPSWITLTTADIEARIPANLLAAIREQYNEEGTDPLNVLIADVTSRVRGAVATCDQYVLDSVATTIPPELRDDAAWLVVGAIMLRLGEATPISDRLNSRLEQAEEHLKAVAACDLAVSKPANAGADPMQSVGGVSVVRKRPNIVTRERLSGLI